MTLKWNYQDLLDVMAWIDEFNNLLQRAGASKDRVQRFQRTFTGKGRRFDSLELALLAHYISAADDVQNAKEVAELRRYQSEQNREAH